MKTGNKDRVKKEFDELLLEVRKVTRVTTWWRQLSFRATVLAWNKKGKIWIWVSKGADVSIAVSKASREAYKNMFDVPMTKAQTVPYTITYKYKACYVRLIPATQGTGLKAWSSVRSVLELAWYENILSKIIGSNNKLNNAIATVNALCSYKHPEHFSKLLTKKDTKPEHIAEDWDKNTEVESEKPAKISEKKETVAEKKAPAKKTKEVQKK